MAISDDLTTTLSSQYQYREQLFVAVLLTRAYYSGEVARQESAEAGGSAEKDGPQDAEPQDP